MPRVHLWCPDWLHRRMRLERPNLNQSKLYNRALLAELDGPEAVYICDACGQKTARLFTPQPAEPGPETRFESA